MGFGTQCLLLVALAACAFAGLPGIYTPGEKISRVSCCVRTYLRNTGERGHLEDKGQFHVYVDSQNTPPRPDWALVDEASEIIVRDSQSQGSVIPHDTMCVESGKSPFKSWFQLYKDETGYSASNGGIGGFGYERNAEGNFECEIYTPSGSVGVVITDGEEDCALMQSCVNVQLDNTPCNDWCSDYCTITTFTGYGGVSTFPRNQFDNDARYGGFDAVHARRCEDECVNRCENRCVGICFNNEECIDDCMSEAANDGLADGRRKRSEERITMSDGEYPTDGKALDDGFFTRPRSLGTPQLVLDFLFGKASTENDVYRNNGGSGPAPAPAEAMTASNKKRSMERPTFHARSGELEYSMAVFPNADCNDIQEMCTSKKSRRFKPRY